jgi:hypothetical protein
MPQSASLVAGRSGGQKGPILPRCAAVFKDFGKAEGKLQNEKCKLQNESCYSTLDPRP